MVGELDSLSAVLDLIRTGEAKGRPDLQRVTGLGRGLISERVNQLLRSTIVVEGDLSASTGGRAARELELNAGGGVVLVYYAQLRHFLVGVTDLSGKVLASHHEICDFGMGPEHVLGLVEGRWHEMLAELGRSASDIWGIGVGVPAHSNFESGTFVDSPSLPANWSGYPLRRALSAKFDAPVWLETCDNVLALGALRTGVARRQSNFVYLTADLAVGCGIVSDGRVMRGAQGAAGNIGHITIGGDALCRCGRRGCLEAVAGGEALLREAEAAGRSRESRYFAERLDSGAALNIRDLAIGARQGDEISQQLVAMSGTTIGMALAATINVLNPAMVVADGCLPQLGDLFLASMREAIYRHSLPFVTRELAIVVVDQSDQTGLAGAAQMVLDEIFLPSCLAKWFETGRPTAAIHQG
ncbi:ROK family protein [Kaistia terrae]|uniref:ROK family protein n=1 Tax=Kaistia terrae TaxID=537017 RepID=A0ABW0PPB9_9HYPH|nr:ROK family protein [Kaistia terrae]MCX5577674.1 ROK family protein [Kaistia terrae]